MGSFRRDNGRGNRGSGRNSGARGFGGRRNSGGRDRPRPEMHDVICDKCKKECQVPFKPSGDKPVLCSDCFKSQGNSRGSGSGISPEQFKELSAKVDKILEILEN